MQKDYLQIKDLNICYYFNNGTVNVVNGIDLGLKDDETLGLVGGTGTGRTTTTLSIMGLPPPEVSGIVSRSIVLDGEELVKSPEKEMRLIRGREAATIFQDSVILLSPLQTVGEQIGKMVLLHNHFGKQELSNQMDELMERVRLSKGRRAEHPHQFSDGMKQRVVIATALACNPKLLTADRPTTVLDVTIQAQILNLMEDLRKEYHTSMLLTTHDLGIVVEMCDRVAIMYAGEIVESGSVEQIYSTPLHPYTQGLFSSVPSLDDDKHRLTPVDGLIPDPINLSVGCRFHPRCPYATELCKISLPVSKTENDHHVMCWYWKKQKEGN